MPALWDKMESQTENRREFHRIFFEAPVAIIDGHNSHKAELIDISLNGALIKNTGNWTAGLNHRVQLKITLSGDAKVIIIMQATVSHIEDDRVGLKREHIDMDSISHLRRLVELNLGDNELLHRDLEHLISSDS